MTSSGATHPDDLTLALALADAADAISLPRFGASDLKVTAKPDLTPVSDADLAVETAIRAILTAQRPDDVVVGEEFGGGAADAPTTGRRWVVDPIDGTKNYVRGVPVWATLIALFDGDDVVVGVVSAPALARRWWAAQGGGAFTRFAGGPVKQISVSGVADLADASLTYSDPKEWQEQGRGPQFAALLDACWRTRGYGDFLPYMLVAEGAADIAAEPELSLWDLAALVPVVREAGGRFTDVDGAAVDQRTVSAMATNGLLHAEVVARLAR
ncbi:histidinol-phosphatase [Nakamurella panacisegetis]|uniref:histidinol-phosphatase n=1 Tax=Nakamurella panacisegetis TaxID=1090615 RepID=UPI001E5D5EFD|nr:histidinol-phosphatase [Nakamurella panacisegetis]